MLTAVRSRNQPNPTNEWVEFDDARNAGVPSRAAGDLIELDPPIVYPSQHAMRFGEQTYTPRQAEVIDLAVRTRRPLRVPPLPIDD
ncbi:MAG: hypothetical protein WKF33_10550 [Thermoleophilaceae bacterium]